MSEQRNRAISFSIQQLSKPDFVVEVPLKLNLEEDVDQSHPAVLSEEDKQTLVGEEGLSGRIHAKAAADISGLEGHIKLAPLGQHHLGESITCYVSCCNTSGSPLTLVEIVVEVSTVRSRTQLFENRDTLIEELKPDECKDFLIKYDIKEVGEHTMKFLASYTTSAKEQVSAMPQLLSFVAIAPLSIRTKVRSMGESCLLETCLECLKMDEPLVLDYVKFDPVKRYVVTPIAVHQDDVQTGPLKTYINDLSMKLMSAHHNTRNFLFRLDPVVSGVSQRDLEVTTLGKLEIKWHTRFGEVGRLQTQQIQSQRRDSSLCELIGRVAEIDPPEVRIYETFEVVIRIGNYTEDAIGPFYLAFQEDDETNVSAIKLSGLQRVVVDEVQGGESVDLVVPLVSLRSGIQVISNLKLFDEGSGVAVGVVHSHEIFVMPVEA